MVGSADYTVFGGVRAQSGQNSALGFTGELFTPQTNLLHLQARDLNPSLGRFLSADTIQPNAPGTQGFNLYAYVANNPTTWVDHSGHTASGATTGQAAATLSHSQAAIVAGLIASLPALVVAGTLGGLALGIASVFLLMACILYGDCLAMVGDAASTIAQYGSAAGGAAAWSADQLDQAPAGYPFLPSAPTPIIPALPPWWAATPTPGTYLSAGPTNTPTPGIYFTSPLLPFPTATAVPSGNTNWSGTVMYPALQYLAVDAPEAQWGWSWAGKLLGHSAGAFPKAPLIAGGVLLTVGPNVIYNYTHGGPTNPELWEDLTLDLAGFGLSYYAGAYTATYVGAYVGSPGGIVGVVAGLVIGWGVGWVWDNYGGPAFEYYAVDPYSSWIRG